MGLGLWLDGSSLVLILAKVWAGPQGVGQGEALTNEKPTVILHPKITLPGLNILNLISPHPLAASYLPFPFLTLGPISTPTVLYKKVCLLLDHKEHPSLTIRVLYKPKTCI
jgi:hypothetical protein